MITVRGNMLHPTPSSANIHYSEILCGRYYKNLNQTGKRSARFKDVTKYDLLNKI